MSQDEEEAARRLSQASDFDMDKVVTTLKQFVRDWSKEVWLVVYDTLYDANLPHPLRVQLKGSAVMSLF